MGEIKAEMKAMSLHIQMQNGSIAKHFADDLTFQTSLLARETIQNLAAAKAQGFRAGLLWFLGGTLGVGIGLGLGIARVMFH